MIYSVKKIEWRRKVNLNRKRGIRVMRRLKFSEDTYELDESNKRYNYKGSFGSGKVIGLFELIWTGINKSSKGDLTKKDHKIIKRLKAKLREVSIFRDTDQD